VAPAAEARSIATPNARWLFAGMLIARTSVSLQYQGITILGVSLGGNDVLAAGDIGVLLALYTAFGLAASIASPLIVQRFGISIPVRLALLMMAIGQFAMLKPASYTWLVACRALAGVGGSLIYVITLEGVAGISNLGSLAIRMGLIAATWPLGNALSLVIMPLLGGVAGLPVAMSLPIWTVAIAMLLLAWSTRESPPPVNGATPPAQAIGPFLRSWGNTMGRTWPVGLSFALYNSAFVLFTSFSVQLFLEQGYSVSSAEQLASIPMWMFLISVPAGGLLSAFLRTHDRALIVAGCLAAVSCFVLTWMEPKGGTWVVLAGLAGGVPTAPMLALAANRAQSVPGLTYGTMFAVFFALMLVLPPLVGRLISASGTTGLLVAILVQLILPCCVTVLTKQR
jgi:Major Facilitator Superfamily